MLTPVFWHELSAATRGSRLHGLRWIYGSLVLTQIFTLLPPLHMGLDGRIAGWRWVDFHAERPFWRLTVQQLAVLLVCAPALVAGAFTTEKVGGTLLPLFLTPLTPWQIVRDKFLSRLAQLLLLSLTGVPGLAAAAAFWDGDFPPILAIAVATTGPLCLVTAVSLLASVWCRTTAEALFASYVPLVALAGAVLAGGDILRPLGPTHVLDPALIAPALNPGLDWSLSSSSAAFLRNGNPV